MGYYQSITHQLYVLKNCIQNENSRNKEFPTMIMWTFDVQLNITDKSDNRKMSINMRWLIITEIYSQI